MPPTLPLYTTGGTVQAGGGIYLSRQADAELFTLCQSGAFAYILTSRQMGKSSLMVQTATQLGQEGIRSATVDLSELGVQVTAEQWYLGFLAILEEQLGLETDVVQWWQARNHLGLTQRMTQFFKEVLLVEIAAPVVIFVDEIDSTLSLDFTDDFFAAIRYFYVARSQEPAFHRLSFVLIGVAAPSDLIRDKSRTPFNIGREIVLAGFQIAEVQPLMAGLVDRADDPPAVLSAVLAWTGGQPFLTQKLCQLIADADSPIAAGNEVAAIEQLVRSRILENWETQDQPEHLRTIRDRLLTGGEQRSGRRLGLCQQIVQQADVAVDDSPEQTELRLTGLVVKRQGKLHIYNRIYEQVFNGDWLGRSLANLRPYGGAIAAWLASDMQDDLQLLRGQELQKARDWAQDKSLGDDDRRFLDASQEREMQTRLAAEQEANQILTVATQKANRRNLFSLVGAGAALVVAGIAVPSALVAWKARDVAQGEVTTAQRQKDQLEADKTQLVAQNTKLEAKEKEAEAKVKSAEQKYQQARTKEQAARQQYQQAQQQVQQAQVKLVQVDQDKVQAEQAKNIAEQQLQTATTSKQQAEIEVHLAQNTLAQAQQVTQIERTSTLALRQFENQPISALVSALEAGQQLQALVRQKAKTKGVKLINHKLALGDYPTYSPIYPLHQILNQIQIREILTRQGNIRSVSWTSDGQILATGGSDAENSADDTVKLWTPTGELIKTLNTQQGSVGSVSWSGDGQTLATGGNNGTVKLWTRSGEEIKTFNAHKTSVWSMSWSSDGQILATGGYDGTVKLWSQNGEAIKVLNPQQGTTIWSVSWSGDGQTLATGGDDGTVKLWNRNGEVIRKLNPYPGSILTVSWSPDGQTLATGDEYGFVKLWNHSGGMIKSFHTQQGVIDGETRLWSVSWSSDGKTLATGGDDGTVKLWSRNGEAIKTLHAQGSVYSVSWSGDGILAMSGSDGILKLWNPSKETIKTIRTQSYIVNSMSWSGDGQILATGGDDGGIELWSRNGKAIKSIKAQQGRVNSMSWSGDGQTLATGGNDGTVKLWSRNGEAIKTLYANRSWVLAVGWVGGETLATGGIGGTIKLWSRSGEVIKTINTQQRVVRSMSWTEDGQILATGDDSGIVKLWSSNGEAIKTIQAHEGIIWSMSWSGDGQILATSDGGLVKLWSRNGEAIKTINPQQGSIFSVSWSGDGQILETGGGTVKLWSRSGEEIQFISVQQVSVSSISWSKDGQILAIGGAEGRVSLLPIEDLDTLVARGCRWANSYLISNPSALKRLTVCQTQERLRAAAPNLVADSDDLARSGNIEAAIQGFKTAQQWYPNLTFDPVARANELAKAAKSPSHP